MQIKLNEKKITIDAETTLLELKSEYKPDADIMVLNGFPVESDRELEDGDSVVFIQRGEVPAQDELESLLVARHTPGVHKTLKQSCVGIAGLGGLGSNIAISLARVGIGSLILVDYDVVEPSNLNRQQFFIDQIGEYKVDALSHIITRINPFIEIVTHNIKITEENIRELFGDADVIVEALDRAETKAMFIENVLLELQETPIVAGVGMAGYGKNEIIHTRQIDNLFICGDEETEAREGRGLMAPRVGIVANMQANKVMEILLEKK
jgi:sulfur carrier protein ThiS adenylyltransferase